MLFAAGSASQRNVWFTAVLLVLLNDDAVRFSPCEGLPPAAVAVPVAGRLSVPRMVPAPLTSSGGGWCRRVDADLARGPTARLKYRRIDDGRCSAEDRQIVEGPAGGGHVGRGRRWTVAVVLLDVDEPMTSGPASTKAEGGSPPMVSASPAFNA